MVTECCLSSTRYGHSPEILIDIRRRRSLEEQLLRVGLIKVTHTFHDFLKQWSPSVTKRGPSARPRLISHFISPSPRGLGRDDRGWAFFLDKVSRFLCNTRRGPHIRVSHTKKVTVSDIVM